MEELTGPLQDVFKDLRRHWKEFQEAEPFLHVLQGFIHAVDWREPWIISILVFHLMMFVTALTTRKRYTIQAVIFIIAGAVIMSSERLNGLGAQHWQRFSTQNYFDRSGVFMSAVVAGPLLLTMFLVLINYLLSCAGMLVEAKKRELIYKAKLRAKEAKKAKEGKADSSTKKEN